MNDGSRRLEALYNDVGPSLLAYLRRWSRDAPSAAEDLLHDTFCQAARRPDQLRQVRSGRAWLFTIARNLAVSALRRPGTSAGLPDDVAAEVVDEDPRLEAMQAAITDLPHSLRETLELRLKGELSYEEIADVLGIPVGTVRSRLHHAVRRLRATLTAQ